MFTNNKNRVKPPFKLIHFSMLIGILMAKLTAFEEFSSLGYTAFSGTAGFDPAIHFFSTFMLYLIVSYIAFKLISLSSTILFKWVLDKYISLMHNNVYIFVFIHIYVVFVLFMFCIGVL